MGINFHVHWTLRTIRTRIKAAKNARQNASNNPLDSAGHWSKMGAFAKKPLVLHINAAAMISSLPRHNGDKYVESVALSAESIIEEDLRKSRMTYGNDSRINWAAVFSTQTENVPLQLMSRRARFNPVPDSIRSRCYQIAGGVYLRNRAATNKREADKKRKQRIVSNEGCNAKSIAIDYFLRCRILARIRRFLRPNLRRPLPVFLVPTRMNPCFDDVSD